MVNSVVVDFNGAVDIAAGAFVLERKNGANWMLSQPLP